MCARWNRTTGPLGPYRFEACTHHRAGSCTQNKIWFIGGGWVSRRDDEYSSDPYCVDDDMPLIWPRLFDSAVLLVRTPANATGGEHRPLLSSPVCGESKRLPRRYFHFQMGLSPVKLPREFPQGVCLCQDGCPDLGRPRQLSRMGRMNGVLFHCGALLNSHPPLPLQ
jgi:hypothetical protein